MWAVLSSLISLFFAMAASTDSPLSDCPANEISNINEQSSQVNIDTIMYPCALFILVHPGAFWCILVHSGASWCILVHPGASWRIQVHHSASWCESYRRNQLIHRRERVKAYWTESCLAHLQYAHAHAVQVILSVLVSVCLLCVVFLFIGILKAGWDAENNKREYKIRKEKIA